MPIKVLTKAQLIDAAEEVDGAFTALLAHNPTAVGQFEEAFKIRSTMPGLVETHKGVVGIEGALAEHLGNLFMIIEEGVACEESQSMPSEEFVADFKEAIKLLVEDHPFALSRMKTHHQERQSSMEIALQTMFSDYFRNRKVFPY